MITAVEIRKTDQTFKVANFEARLNIDGIKSGLIAFNKPMYWSISAVDYGSYSNYSYPIGVTADRVISTLSNRLCGDAVGTPISSTNWNSISCHKEIPYGTIEPYSSVISLSQGLCANFAILYDWYGNGQLSGYTPGVSGLVDYDTGEYILDYHGIPSGNYSLPPTIVQPSAANIVGEYSCYIGPYTWNTIDTTLSTCDIRITATNLDQKYYRLSAFVLDNTYTPSGIDILFAIKSVKLNNIDTFVTYATLSATYFTTEQFSIPSDDLITWTSSNTVSAIFLKESPNTIRQITSATSYQGAALTADYVKFFSDSNATKSFRVCAIPSDPTLYASYNFNYEPVVTDDLIIDQISATNFSSYLQLYRIVNGNYRYKIDALSAIKWLVSPTTNVMAYSGLTGLDINLGTDSINNLNMSYASEMEFNTIGYSNVQSIALTGMVNTTPTVTAHQNTLGSDFIKMTFDPNIVSVYAITGYLPNSPTYNDVYNFVPNFGTTAIEIVQQHFDNQPYIRDGIFKVYSNVEGILTDVDTNLYLSWECAEPNVWATINNVPYTFGYNNSGVSTDYNTIHLYMTADKFTSSPKLSTIYLINDGD